MYKISYLLAFLCSLSLCMLIGCDETDTAGGGGPADTDVTFSVCAVSIVDANQGLLKNSNPVSSNGVDNCDPAYALMGPDSGSRTYGTFFSLGFGGDITVEFDDYVGGHLFIYEATWGEYPEEIAEVYVSDDGVSWTLLGEATNGGGDPDSDEPYLTVFELDNCIKFVKLIDITDPAPHVGKADAFDVDVICAEFSCSGKDCPIAGIEVTDVAQGTKKSGDPVDPGRSDPDAVLGPPDGIFFSMGFDGYIVIKFSTPVTGGITVFEVTGGTYPEEKVEVYVSLTGGSWTFLGIADNLGGPDKIRPTSFILDDCIQYVKIVDVTDRSLHGATADGFELDAVCALEECPPIDIPECIIPAFDVVDSAQGDRNGGGPVDPARSDPMSTVDYPDGVYYSLGFGGEIILEFANFVKGNLTVYEYTTGTYPSEAADVFVSMDGISWTYLGVADNSVGRGIETIHPTDFPLPGCIKFVKLIDVTDGALHNSTADGFDLDAVCADTLCSTTDCFIAATSVFDYGQGKMKNGKTIPTARSDPNSALGSPDGTYFSMGYGGYIILELPYYVTGNITIYEITLGSYPIEKVEVYGSEDGVSWTLIGIADNSAGLGSDDLHPFDLYTDECIKFLQIIDVTDASLHGAKSDGYDLDAVCAEEICEPDDDDDKFKDGKFCTHTQGHWGQKCAGKNAGCLRDAYFDSCFPDGLMIGCDAGYTAEFTTSEAIANFLPAGGKSGSLTRDYVDPTTKTDAGGLAGQTVALTLNVGFNLCGVFGVHSVKLKDLIIDIPGSPFYNMTVEEILEIANNVVGGCDTTTPPNKINGIVSAINGNFNDCKDGGGIFRLP